MKISIVIRNATPRDRYAKAQALIEEKFLDSFDIAHVGHKFPKLDASSHGWLKERLGKAIVQRRQYLKYCRDHHEKFSHSQPQDQADDERTRLPRLNFGGPHLETGSRTGTAKSVPVSAFALTDASTLQVSRLKPIQNIEDEIEDLSDNHSQTSYATSIHDGTNQNKLKPPVLIEVTNTFPFECPYCWSIQESSNEKAWR